MAFIYNILGFVAVILFVGLIIAILKPSALKRVFGTYATRLKSIAIIVALMALTGGLLSATEPDSVKQARLDKAAKAEQAKILSQQQVAQTAAAEQKQITSSTQTSVSKAATEPEARPTAKLYTVSKVVDGDTLDVKIQGKNVRVRLIGIDTPEKKDPRKIVECFASEASAQLSKLVLGKQVALESDRSQGDKDKYKRLLRYVKLGDTNINLQMIVDGYAYEYTYRTPYAYQQQFKAAQAAANTADRGLWAPNGCNGQRAKPKPTAAPAQAAVAPAPQAAAPAPAPAPAQQSSGGVVKMSSTGICHAPGTTYYDRTTNFTPYPDMDSCLAAGGRLPQR